MEDQVEKRPTAGSTGQVPDHRHPTNSAGSPDPGNALPRQHLERDPTRTHGYERPPAASPLAAHWELDPEITFLNHGSFGACPRPVLAAQEAWRRRMERQPLLFLGREVETLLDDARAALAAFLHADPDNLVFVPNATAGVNTVLRSLPLSSGDEVIVSDHEYNACRNALNAIAAGTGAIVRVVHLPFPLEDTSEITAAIVEAAGPRTRLLLIDHITSPSALVLPIETIVREMSARGIDTLVDGAHGPGMVDLHLEDLGATFYTGNCHKWLCAPKGAGFLHVHPKARSGVRPLAISHGANSRRTDRDRFRMEFDWTGTFDPSPYLSVPAAIEFMGNLLPGGWPALMEANRALALHARRILSEVLRIPLPCPDSMIGSMAALPLPGGDFAALQPPLYLDPLQERLWNEDRIEVPVPVCPDPPLRLLRISAQVYNAPEQYEFLAERTCRLLREEGTRC